MLPLDVGVASEDLTKTQYNPIDDYSPLIVTSTPFDTLLHTMVVITLFSKKVYSKF